jgi:hypothetical protein
MGPVEIAGLAREFLSGPHRQEILYRGTNRVNRAALARVIETRRFAEQAANSHEAHPSPHNRGGKGWHKLREATPGAYSGHRREAELMRKG